MLRKHYIGPATNPISDKCHVIIGDIRYNATNVITDKHHEATQKSYATSIERIFGPCKGGISVKNTINLSNV